MNKIYRFLQYIQFQADFQSMDVRVAGFHIKQAKCVNEFAYFQNKNSSNRPYMEDNYIAQDAFLDNSSGIFAILDGHGGSKVSQYCTQAIPKFFKQQFGKGSQNIKQILQAVFKKIDYELKQLGCADQTGSTCCLAFIRTQNDKRICDTRAVLLQIDQARRVTTDHKVSNEAEQQRIKNQGGFIFQGRVGGQLAITRALGDLSFKQIGVSNVPQLQEFTITQDTRYLIIASDGLWDVCQDQKAIQIVKELGTTKEMSRHLVNFAIKNGSKDNISVLVLKL